MVSLDSILVHNSQGKGDSTNGAHPDNNIGKNNPNYNAELHSNINGRGVREQALQKMMGRSPIKIPRHAKKNSQIKKGYAQVKFIWRESGVKYESRWHTRTPGAPQSQGNIWVVTKRVPGNTSGQRAQEFVKVKDHGWIPKQEWKNAVTARQNGTSTSRQEEILNKGHWADK